MVHRATEETIKWLKEKVEKLDKFIQMNENMLNEQRQELNHYKAILQDRNLEEGV